MNTVASGIICNNATATIIDSLSEPRAVSRIANRRSQRYLQSWRCWLPGAHWRFPRSARVVQSCCSRGIPGPPSAHGGLPAAGETSASIRHVGKRDSPRAR
jgi:hypothetical protein